MNTKDKLTELFKMFPGIGERQANRFVYFLMAKNANFIKELVTLLSLLSEETKQCSECFRFFSKKERQHKNNSNMCDMCSDPNTDFSSLLIVERDSDLESIKKSKTYTGKYFVLGGLVSVVEKNNNRFVRIDELKKRISEEKKKDADKRLKEIILAFSLSPQGEHTDFYIRNEIKSITEPIGIKISSLGRGLSTGTELEYSDNDTIKNALKNRQ